MKTFEEAKLMMAQYASISFDGAPQGCNLCCSSHGGGKARYQDSDKKVSMSK